MMLGFYFHKPLLLHLQFTKHLLLEIVLITLVIKVHIVREGLHGVQTLFTFGCFSTVANALISLVTLQVKWSHSSLSEKHSFTMIFSYVLCLVNLLSVLPFSWSSEGCSIGISISFSKLFNESLSHFIRF